VFQNIFASINTLEFILKL